MPLTTSTDRVAAVRQATDRARSESAQIRAAVDRCLADSRLRIELTRDLLQDPGPRVDSV